jgi:drug/metabolite transporter (DMT)-like permease
MQIGVGLSFAKMMFSSMTIIFLRYLREVHVALVLFISGLLALLQNVSLAMALGVFNLTFEPEHWIYVGMLSLFSFLGHLCLALALKCEQAGPFAILSTSDSIFAFLLQFFVFGIVPDEFRY